MHIENMYAGHLDSKTDRQMDIQIHEPLSLTQGTQMQQ
jgi:hypothetical protein